MSQFVWVTKETVAAVHDAQIAEHGGMPGIRDEGLVEPALMRPQNLVTYEGSEDVARLAAAYAYGICRNHELVDGNKRTALVIADTFLMLNGYELTSSAGDNVVTMLGVAGGTVSEDELAEWFSENVAPL